MARAFHRAIASSIALGVLAVLVGVAVTSAPGHSEAARAEPARVAAFDEQLPGQSLAERVTPRRLDPIAPAVARVFDELVEPPILEPPAVAAIEPEAGRRVTVAAIGQAAGPPPLTTEERRAALIDQVRERADVPDVTEPPFTVTLERNPVLTASPSLAPGDVVEATISFYYCTQGDTPSGGDGGGFCGAMRDGTIVYEGAAACAWTYLGQRFRIVGDPTGRIYTCHDTGSAVHGLHRDIFFHEAADGWPWLWSVGTTAILEILE